MFFCVDQLRKEALGLYGNSQVKTPNIDALGKQGVVHHAHYTDYPVCIPSRYAVLTGLSYKDMYNVTMQDENNNLPFCHTTYPFELKKNGYNTQAVGKVHLEPPYHDVGFNDMLLCEQIGPGRWVDDYHRYLKSQGLVNQNCLEDQNWEFRRYADSEYWENFGAKENTLSQENASTGWIAAKAMEKVRGWGGENPECLYVSFVTPHHPVCPPKPWCDMYDAQLLEPLPGWTDYSCLENTAGMGSYFEYRNLSIEKYKRYLSYYYALVSEIDHHVGEIIKVLKDKGLYDDTAIIFTTDHGDYLGFHHLLLKGNLMHEPTVNIPLVIKYPKSRNISGANENLSSNIDLCNTILDIAAVDIPKQMEGNILLSDQNAGREIVFSTDRQGQRVAVRYKNYKYLRNKDLDSDNSFFHSGCDIPNRGRMLFDLESDPGELSNIYEANKDIADMLDAEIINYFKTDSFKGTNFSKPFCAKILAAENAQEATQEIVRRERDHFLAEFKRLRNIVE